MSLTRQVWHRGQLLCPVFRDLDGLMFHCLTFGRHSLFIGMDHNLLQVVRIQGVENVEEVVTGRSLSGRILVREVGHEDRVLRELRIKSFDGELIVVWHSYLLHLHLLEQLLLADQDILEEVFVDEALRWQIKLEAVVVKICEMFKM